MRSSSKGASILIVDADFGPLQKAIAELEWAGFQVTQAGSLTEVRAKTEISPPSLTAVEWTHPARVEVLKALTPSIVTADRPSGIDAVVALESGAVDYVPKPLDPPVFLARVRAVLRRAALGASAPRAASKSDTIALGPLEVSLDAKVVRCAGRAIELSQSEFAVLEALLGARGRVMSRRSLINEVIGEDAKVTSRVIDTHVFTLRRKLGVCGKRVQTVRGVGYRLD